MKIRMFFGILIVMAFCAMTKASAGVDATNVVCSITRTNFLGQGAEVVLFTYPVAYEDYWSLQVSTDLMSTNNWRGIQFSEILEETFSPDEERPRWYKVVYKSQNTINRYFRVLVNLP